MELFVVCQEEYIVYLKMCDFENFYFIDFYGFRYYVDTFPHNFFGITERVYIFALAFVKRRLIYGKSRLRTGNDL